MLDDDYKESSQLRRDLRIAIGWSGLPLNHEEKRRFDEAVSRISELTKVEILEAIADIADCSIPLKAPLPR